MHPPNLQPTHPLSPPPPGSNELESLSKKEVLSMLRFGADRIFSSTEGRPPSDAELDAIIDRSGSAAAAAATVGVKQEGGELGCAGLGWGFG